MSVDFIGQEIIELAIRIEVDGEVFYRQLAERSKKDNVRTAFTYLANEEREHAKTFRHIMQAISTDEDAQERIRSGSDLLTRIARDHIPQSFTIQGLVRTEHICTKVINDFQVCRRAR